MKNGLILFFLILSIKGNAQIWCPPGSVWTYTFEPAFASGIYRFEYIDDTIINSINCKIIQKSVVSKFFSEFEYHTTVVENHILYADSDKVYFYYNDQFNLLYDFSAQVGDTLHINGLTRNHWPNSCDSIATLRVDTVGTMNINSENLRFYSVHTISGSAFSWDCRIVEKIGPFYNYGNNASNYFFPFKSDWCGFVTDEEPEGGNFKCYKDDAFMPVSLSFDSCSFTLGIEKNGYYNFEVYPNPTIDELIISFNNYDSKYVSIYNEFGQLLTSQKINEFSFKLKMNNFSPGIYLLEIYDEKGKRGIRKIIKR